MSFFAVDRGLAKTREMWNVKEAGARMPKAGPVFEKLMESAKEAVMESFSQGGKFSQNRDVVHDDD